VTTQKIIHLKIKGKIRLININARICLCLSVQHTVVKEHYDVEKGMTSQPCPGQVLTTTSDT
jgi:hypothetical protein